MSFQYLFECFSISMPSCAWHKVSFNPSESIGALFGKLHF